MKTPTSRSHKSLIDLASIRRTLGTVFITTTLSACGGGGGGGSAAPTPTPIPVDNTPVAVDDSFTIDQDTVLNADISTNDSGLEDTPVTYSVDSAATNGAAVVNADGSVTYTPNGGYSGSDSFTYTVVDADGDSATAKVTIDVIADSTAFTWPAVNSVVTEDVDAAVAIILAKMTLAEKVGQMVQAEISQVSPAQVRDYNLGSVLNGGGTWPNGKIPA